MVLERDPVQPGLRGRALLELLAVEEDVRAREDQPEALDEQHAGPEPEPRAAQRAAHACAAPLVARVFVHAVHAGILRSVARRYARALLDLCAP